MVYDLHQPKVIGVLDWELSTLGHPLGDLAYCCMMYHIDGYALIVCRPLRALSRNSRLLIFFSLWFAYTTLTGTCLGRTLG